MNHLVDRYLVVVLGHLPEGQRQDVGAELRASIADMVDARAASGESENAATRAVLTDLGDPVKLARSYDQRPHYLIGPAWFPYYIGVLRAVVPIVSLVLAGITAALGIADEEPVGSTIVRALGTAFQIGLQTAFWITLTFALIERFSSEQPDEDREWSIDDLPKERFARQIGLGTTVFNVLVPIALGVVVIVQARSGVGAFVRGFDDRAWSDMPFVNPDLPAWIVAGFFGILLLSMVVPVIRYRVGSWTPAMFGLAVIESAVWIAFTALVASGWPIVNPALGEELDPGGTWWETGGDANLTILAVVVITSAIDLWDAWQGYRQARTKSLVQAPAP